MLDLGAVDGVVGGDVEIVRILRDFVALRNVVVGLVGGRSHADGVAQAFGLFEGLLCPDTGLEVSRLGFEQVHRNHQELEGCTAAEEEDLIILGDVEQFAPEGTGLRHDGVPFLGAVGNTYYRHSGACEVLEGLDGTVDGSLRQNARAGIEVVRFFHIVECCLML